MNKGFFYCIVAVIVFVIFPACAGSKTAMQGNKYGKITKATIQRTIPGRKEAEVEKQYHFTLAWLSTQKPETFFWKSQDGWMNCIVHMTEPTKENGEYTEVNLNEIRKGDVLELTPIRGGKFPIPEAIPAHLNNVIVFKTNKSNWLYLSVNDLKTLPDIVMP